MTAASAKDISSDDLRSLLDAARSQRVTADAASRLQASVVRPLAALLGEIGLVPTAGAVAAALHAYDGMWRAVLPMRRASR